MSGLTVWMSLRYEAVESGACPQAVQLAAAKVNAY